MGWQSPLTRVCEVKRGMGKPDLGWKSWPGQGVAIGRRFPVTTGSPVPATGVTAPDPRDQGGVSSLGLAGKVGWTK